MIAPEAFLLYGMAFWSFLPTPLGFQEIPQDLMGRYGGFTLSEPLLLGVAKEILL